MADFYLGKKLRLNPSLKCKNYYVLHVAFPVFFIGRMGLVPYINVPYVRPID